MKFIIYFLFLFPVMLYCSIINVNIDGSAEFTSICAAMEEAIAGDTLLVHPGTYYESVILNKDISIISLYYFNNDEYYIDNTIIDGGNIDRVIGTINFNLEEYDVLISGFTVQNGFARDPEDLNGLGAGIYASCINIEIKNCKIINNRAWIGGGVALTHSTSFLSGNIITGNVSVDHAGGILIQQGNCIFDETDLNSIYLNSGGLANDIEYCNGEGNPITIHLSTFTVAEYSSYFVKSTQDYSIEVPEMCDLIVDNYLIEPVASDFYVSPLGDNSNSGLSIDDPFQTVSFALAMYAEDSPDIHTIHIAEGYYGISANNEKLPWHLHSNLILEGGSEENTIVSTEGFPSHIVCREHLENITIRNLTLENGNVNYSIGIYYADNLLIENVTIRNIPMIGNTCRIIRGNVVLRNFKIYDTFTKCPLVLSNFSDQRFLLENVDISGVYQFDDELFLCDNSLAIGTMSDTPFEYARFDIVNCKFTDVYTYDPTWPARVGHGCSFRLFSDVNMVNCLVSNTNVNNDRDPSINVMDSRLNFVNSIVYDVDNYPIYLEWYDMLLPELTVDHSLVQNGVEGVFNGYGSFIVNWFEGNLSCDPLFNMAEPHRYSLEANSPCIDAGTLNLPDGIVLPDTDLAGNPRISGNMIDMGPYEWQYPNSNINSSIFNSQDLVIYPNPLNVNKLRNGFADIIWKDKETCLNLTCDVFNIKGQKVKSAIEMDNIEGESYSAKWDVKNNAGKFVACGVYFIRVKSGNSYLSQQKIIVVK